MATTNKKTYYAFKIINCKVPHWKKGKISREEENIVFLDNGVLGIRKENLYTNEKEALMEFVEAVNTCNKGNVEGIYGSEDLKAYHKGKQLLLKKRQQELDNDEQTED
jgi:hypothetical protein